MKRSDFIIGVTLIAASILIASGIISFHVRLVILELIEVERIK